MIRTTPIIALLSLLAAGLISNRPLLAQQYPSVERRQFPLNQMSPPGLASQMAISARRITKPYFQPVRVLLPGSESVDVESSEQKQPQTNSGTVTFYETAGHPVELAAPAQVSLLVGNTYRLKVSNVEGFANQDFYPSIELIDRLHPPAGQEENFPVQFEFTNEELEWAASGRMVTKVVYLEQPQQIPSRLVGNHSLRITTIEPNRNIVAEADLLGRPMAIVRLGGRTPDPVQPDPTFFGPGGPIRMMSTPLQASSRPDFPK